MRSLNEAIITNGDASGNLVSEGVSLEYQLGYSIQIDITGSPVGVLSLQGSNDFAQSPPGGPVEGQAVINWTDIVASTQNVTGAGSTMYNVQWAFYKWVRLVYTATSGTGTINARVNTKG